MSTTTKNNRTSPKKEPRSEQKDSFPLPPTAPPSAASSMREGEPDNDPFAPLARQDTANRVTEALSQASVDDSVDVGESSWGFLQAVDKRGNLRDVQLTKTLEGAVDGLNADANQGERSTHPGGYLIGRHNECDVIISHPKISSRHCLVYKETCLPDGSGGVQDRVMVQDLSTNGTWVNGQLIGRGKRRQIQPGDELRLVGEPIKKNEESFGRYIFRFPTQSSSTSPPCNAPLTVKDVYAFGELLGEGQFAQVFAATHRTTGKKYAIKVFDKNRARITQADAEALRSEAAIIMAVDHPCIVRIYGFYDEPTKLYMVLEYAKGGDVFEHIIKSKNLSEDETRVVFRQIFEAVLYLHDRGISHRDLKPENVLVANTERPPKIKITDFGLSKLVGEGSYMQTHCGTPSYIAPEILSKPTYGKEVDLWSVGVMLYIALCGYPPFSAELSPPSLTDQIIQGKFQFQSPWWDNIDPLALDLVRRLLTVDPAQRLTAREALEHEWMRKETTEKSLLVVPPSSGSDSIGTMPEIHKPLERTNTLVERETDVENEQQRTSPVRKNDAQRVNTPAKLLKAKRERKSAEEERTDATVGFTEEELSSPRAMRRAKRARNRKE